MTEAEAFRHLQRLAMDGRKSMADVAAEILG
jgi:AmiR/NasT family two-component response regulator